MREKERERESDCYRERRSRSGTSKVSGFSEIQDRLREGGEREEAVDMTDAEVRVERTVVGRERDVAVERGEREENITETGEASVIEIVQRTES